MTDVQSGPPFWQTRTLPGLDTRAGAQCPRCGAPKGHLCQTLRHGATIVGYHHERGCSPVELLALGYLKYTLVEASGRYPLFLWRRRSQRAIVRDGYREPCAPR